MFLAFYVFGALIKKSNKMNSDQETRFQNVRHHNIHILATIYKYLPHLMSIFRRSCWGIFEIYLYSCFWRKLLFLAFSRSFSQKSYNLLIGTIILSLNRRLGAHTGSALKQVCCTHGLYMAMVARTMLACVEDGIMSVGGPKYWRSHKYKLKVDASGLRSMQLCSSCFCSYIK